MLLQTQVTFTTLLTLSLLVCFKQHSHTFPPDDTASVAVKVQYLAQEQATLGWDQTMDLNNSRFLALLCLPCEGLEVYPYL